MPKIRAIGALSRSLWLAVVVLLSLFSRDGASGRDPLAPKGTLPALTATAAAARYGKLPMRFEQNTGQFDEQVRFVARGGGATLFLTDLGATLSLRAPQREPASPRLPHERMEPTRDEPGEPDTVLRMKVAGGRTVTPRAEQRLVTISNYFIGNDPSKWRTDVPNFGRVVYPGVLPGVDLVYHGEEGQLEYDFIVAPGADSGEIALEVSGAKELSHFHGGPGHSHRAGGSGAAQASRLPAGDEGGAAGGGGRVQAAGGALGGLRAGLLRHHS